MRQEQLRRENERYIDFLAATTPPNWSIDALHIRLIAENLDKVARGEIDRLAIFMPPRHGKSETTTYRFPVYWLKRNPTDNVLVTGYNERFARKFGRRTRNIASELGITGDKKSADEWETKAGGMLMTRGVGSPPTGTGFQLIVIDDPVRRREDAESGTIREKVFDWYTDDLYSRLEPDGAIILIMTLWHEDDIGHNAIASEPGKWTVLKLPAIAEKADLLGREVGEALWPERFGVESLNRIKSVMSTNEGERSWEALYQQNPTPRQGSFFNVDKIKVELYAPTDLVSQWRAWDKAATKGEGDFTVGVKVGKDKAGRYWILDVVRGQWDTDERDKIIRTTAEEDGKAVKIRGPQDPGSAGKSDALAFIRLLSGFYVITKPVSGAKQLRASPFSAQVNGGNVSMVEAPWNKTFKDELRVFDKGKHDDQVDAASDAYTECSTAFELIIS